MIDSHVHLWDQNRLTYPWLQSESSLPVAFLPEDLREADSTIREFIFVQADCVPTDGLREARWVAELAEASAEVRGVVAFAPLENPDAAWHLEELETIPTIVGVRRLLQDESPDFIRSVDLSAGVRRLAGHGWTFDACVRWQQLPALIDLIRQVPEVTVILDHLGKPPLSAPAFFDAWRRNLADLADLPNTVVKLSGLPAEVPLGVSTPSADYGPWLRAAAELFGAHRSMVGSDWPVSRLPGLTRTDWFETVRESVAPNTREWDQMTRRTASDVYRLPSTAHAARSRHPVERPPR